MRTACKSFARGADEKTGSYTHLLTFITPVLKEKKLRSLKLVRYRRNRFNILLHNASQVYFLHKHNIMINFLESYDMKRLTESVLHDLKVPVHVPCWAWALLVNLYVSPFGIYLKTSQLRY